MFFFARKSPIIPCCCPMMMMMMLLPTMVNSFTFYCLEGNLQQEWAGWQVPGSSSLGRAPESTGHGGSLVLLCEV